MCRLHHLVHFQPFAHHLEWKPRRFGRQLWGEQGHWHCKLPKSHWQREHRPSCCEPSTSFLLVLDTTSCKLLWAVLLFLHSCKLRNPGMDPTFSLVFCNPYDTMGNTHCGPHCSSQFEQNLLCNHIVIIGQVDAWLSHHRAWSSPKQIESLSVLLILISPVIFFSWLLDFALQPSGVAPRGPAAV